jgi:aspartyl-tRNA(Asn)/glutamyl-tRNA(Gln) amidotransferase subunit B
MSEIKNIPVLVGTEIHLQLKTSSKMYCGCRNAFHAEPNSLLCPVCLGEPGALPVINREAYRLGLLAAKALRCDIQEETRFDRKNYFYPDLPKGYQITQFFHPLARDGCLEIEHDGRKKKIRIERIHLEEDSGKLLHQDSQGESWIDFNRAGIPLAEIVTRPDMHSSHEAHLFLSELKLLLKHLGVSDCEMQEGSLRVDLNVNVHLETTDGKIATPIVEIKNLNSFSSVKSCIEYECSRQIADWKARGVTIDNAPKETRGWDDLKQETIPQRLKEALSDYRYFPEPDLPPFYIDKDFLESVPEPEHPRNMQKRLEKEHSLSPEKLEKLIFNGREMVEAFEFLVKQGAQAEVTLNWLINETFEALNDKRCTLSELKVDLLQIKDLIDRITRKEFALRVARKIFKSMLEEGLSAAAVIERDGMTQIDDAEALQNYCHEVIIEFPKVVQDYLSGKEAALNGLMGRVMQKSKGKANPGKVRDLLKELLVNA